MTATTSVEPAIADFAARVRRSLDDLPEDEIEDLTEGLEADLTEKALDEDLGDPEEYAIELRSAAGLPARPVKTGMFWSLAGIRLWRVAVATRIRRHAIGAQLLDFAVALRPGWWILRAWTVFQVTLLVVGGRGIVSTLPETPFRWLFFASLAVVSVQWGRGRWLPQWLRFAKVLISTFALLALPFLLAAAASSAAWAYAESVNPPPEQFPVGLTQNGESITNVFAYDANGASMTGVQLFDQNGKPLSAKPPGGDFITTSDATALVPSDSVTSGNGWNVYPLESIPLTAIDTMTGRPAPDATTTPAKAPFTRVQPLLTPAPLRDGSGVTPAPGATTLPPGTATPATP
jgi:GNAT superfamily N-acetyltransferase